MNTQIITSIAKNIGRLTGSFWADKSTAISEASFIGDTVLHALETHQDVEVAERYLQVAERRLEENGFTFPPDVRRWAENAIKDARTFVVETEEARR